MKPLKIGDKLYEYTIYDMRPFRSIERGVSQFTIIKVNKSTVNTWGRDWKIKKSEIGDKYFTSRKEMYKEALALQKEELDDLIYKSVKPMEKEIKYLQNKIKSNPLSKSCEYKKSKG